jgi:hypothetical protein
MTIGLLPYPGGISKGIILLVAAPSRRGHGWPPWPRVALRSSLKSRCEPARLGGGPASRRRTGADGGRGEADERRRRTGRGEGGVGGGGEVELHRRRTGRGGGPDR